MRRMCTACGGLYVTAVKPGSAAERQGIIAGDVLLGIHGWQTSSMKDLAGILKHPDIVNINVSFLK